MKWQSILNRRVVQWQPNVFLALCTSIWLFLIMGTSSVTHAQPEFAEPVLNPLGLAASTGGDVVSRIRLVDIDHDGTLEAFVRLSDDTPPSYPTQTRYYENSGSNEAPTFTFKAFKPFGIPDQTLDWFGSFVDIDGDGLEDLFFTGLVEDNPVKMVKNTGDLTTPEFGGTIIENPYGLVLPTSDADGGKLDAVFPVFVDIDGDADFDMFYGGYFQNSHPDEAFYIAINEDPSGNGTNPQFAAPIKNPYSLTIPTGVGWRNLAFADMDCDGDMDMYFVGPPANFYYIENTGTLTAPNFSSTAIALPIAPGGVFAPFAGDFIDIGNDGDPDLIHGSRIGIWYHENITPSSTPDFSYTLNNQHATFTDLSTAPSGQVSRWHWDFGDGTTSEEQNPQHTFSTSGNHQVCLTTWNQCRREQHCETVSISVGTVAPELDAEVFLYPSPATTELLVEVQAKQLLNKINFEIYDWTGRKIKAINREVGSNQIQESISLSGMPTGPFLLKICSEGKCRTQKFIKAQ